jgi:formate hydrogenlyase transcriptional activator
MKPTERRRRRMIDSIPTLAWSSLPDGSIDFLNRRWLDYTGLSLAEALGSGWTSAVHPEDLAMLTAFWRELLASGRPGEQKTRLRRFDGEYRWFLFRAEPCLDNDGKVIKWFATSTDITGLESVIERKRTEPAIKENEEGFRELQRMIDAIPTFIHVLRPDGSVLHANRVVLEYIGLGLEDVQRENYRARIFHPDDVDRLRNERRDALAHEQSFSDEERVLGKDGKYRWFLFRYNPERGEHGKIVRWYVTGADIDDRKQEEERVQKENLALREEIAGSSMLEEIVGTSAALGKAMSQLAKVAPTESTVLILGETGTGKELIARAIHRKSKRASRAFVRVNCTAIPVSLIASELFGHEKGAFIGAVQQRIGRFEAADGGTIFLDEIGNLPLETQTSLLHVLQEKEIERLGSDRSISVDVRVIAATNRDLNAAVAAGTFRADLFFRLNVFPISVPSLQERKGDIPLLVEYLVDRYAKKSGKKIEKIPQEILDLLQSYDWPGNVRELQNVIERAVILYEKDPFVIDPTWFKTDPPKPSNPSGSAFSSVVEKEKEIIESALRETQGRISGPGGAAAKLGIPRQTLESKIRALGIDKSRFRTIYR